MPNPPVPEESVELAARAFHPLWTGYSDAAKEQVRIDMRRMLEAAAPAIRKQGAEEAAERCRELEADLREEQRIHGQDAEAARRARSALRACEKAFATTQAERDQALAKGAEQERERVREALLSDTTIHAVAEELSLSPAASIFDHQRLLKERAMRCLEAALDTLEEDCEKGNRSSLGAESSDEEVARAAQAALDSLEDSDE